jgi:hypothetical protein
MYIWMFWSSTSFQKFFCCIIVCTSYSMPNYRLKCALSKGIFNLYSHIKGCDWVCNIILKFHLLAKWSHFIMKVLNSFLKIFKEISPFQICQCIFQFIFYKTYFYSIKTIIMTPKNGPYNVLLASPQLLKLAIDVN